MNYREELAKRLHNGVGTRDLAESLADAMESLSNACHGVCTKPEASYLNMKKHHRGEEIKPCRQCETLTKIKDRLGLEE